MNRILKLLFLALAFNLTTAFADENGKIIRWTGSEDPNGSDIHVIQVLSQKLGSAFKKNDFIVQEDRDLAFSHYKRLDQVSDQIPIHGKSIRIWTDRHSNKTIQVEAALELDKPSTMQLFSGDEPRKTAKQLRNSLTSEKTIALAQKVIQANANDPEMRGVEWKDEWVNKDLVRTVKARGRRGNHQIRIDLLTQSIISQDYREFPQADIPQSAPTDITQSQPIDLTQGDPSQSAEHLISIPAQVFPIYEETEGGAKPLPRVPAQLRYIRSRIPEATGDIFAPLKQEHYYDSRFSPTLGSTEEGRAQGYWAMSYIKQQCFNIINHLPQVRNDFSKGVLLEGLYATVNIHPDALQKYGPLNFTPQPSASFFPNWVSTTFQGNPANEMIPSQAYSGKPITSDVEAWNRPARRLPDHNPTEYMKDGFDELQVYYAINTLFEELKSRGFRDPDLSTRPFNAFLFNPDISYRDNAYYTDDTINFTTYSPGARNYARDNSTIWHELGHGVMDRLMGDNLELADTGGLSEGMADFIAALVIEGVTHGKSFPGSNQFRINNRTGFFLTNEVHDDGEAYGGTMKDFLDAALQQFGPSGLNKVVDVVLEAMRLTRDYPGLTASDWFQHILFADSLGRPGVRHPGELKALLLKALAGRNFKIDGGQTASFTIVNADNNQEILAGTPGSRDHAIETNISKSQTANYKILANVKNSDEFSFRFPVQIKVEYHKGALQGAIHWNGEENNPQVYTLNSEADTVSIPLQVTGTCDEVNRPDGSCVDYAYIQVWNQGETEHPTAKKRFYLRVKNSD